jgi:dephospho-CoA kinase
MRIALTGGVASGKTSIANYLRTKNFPVIDVDKIGHRIVDTIPSLNADLQKVFGVDCFDSKGCVIRYKVGAVVFSDPAALKTLNDLVFPHLYKELQAELKLLEQCPVVFVDAALVYEWGIEADFDQVWIIAAKDRIRINRLMLRNKLSSQEAAGRLKCQMDQDKKISRADFVFYNDEDVLEVEQEVNKVLQKLNLL